MSKKRGLSLEEKRDRMLEIFHESADVFVLKDIEKLAPKKGITQQTVKDVLQSLVDDDLVRQEKIGASNYFWSFPSEASVKVCNEEAAAAADLAAAKKRRQELTAAIEQEKAGKEDSEMRAQLMATLNQLRQEESALQTELEQYKDNDPETVQNMRDAAQVAKAAANRWTDNLHCLTAWCKKQFPGQGDSLQQFFEENGYKDTMDHLE